MSTAVIIPRLVSTEQAAQYLCMSERYVRTLVYRRELTPTVRLNKKMRFDVRDLDVWIERKKVESF